MSDEDASIRDRRSTSQLVVCDFRQYGRDFFHGVSPKNVFGLAKGHLRDTGVFVFVLPLEFLEIGKSLMQECNFHGLYDKGSYHLYVVREPPVARATGEVDMKSVNKHFILHILVGCKQKIDPSDVDPFHHDGPKTRMGVANAHVPGNKYLLKSGIIGGVSPPPMRANEIQCYSCEVIAGDAGDLDEPTTKKRRRKACGLNESFLVENDLTLVHLISFNACYKPWFACV